MASCFAKSEMSSTLFAAQTLFKRESYPKVKILLFSNPFTSGSHSGQNDPDLESTQVSLAEPFRPWTKTMLMGGLEGSSGKVASRTVLRPNSEEASSVFALDAPVAASSVLDSAPLEVGFSSDFVHGNLNAYKAVH